MTSSSSSSSASPALEETKPLGSINQLPEPPKKAVLATVERALDRAEIRARRRPRAALLVWFFEFVCAFLIASPLQAWASAVWGAHPDGDAVLFRPGGHALLTWLGEDSASLSILTRGGFISLLVFAIVGQIISASAIATLSSGDQDGRPLPISRSLRSGASLFWPFFVVGILINALQGFILGIGLLTSSGLDNSFTNSMGDARSWTLHVVVFGLFVLLALAAGVLADLTRVALVRGKVTNESISTGRRLREAIMLALRTAKKSFAPTMLAWGWRAAIAFLLIYVGSVAGDVIGERGGAALWGLFFLHQAILLVRAALRTSWFANALRLIS